MGRLALKTVELTVGKQLNIKATIQNQTGVPNWEQIPQEVRDRFIEALAHAPEVDVVDVTPESVPQTDEGYAAYREEEGDHDSRLPTAEPTPFPPATE